MRRLYRGDFQPTLEASFLGEMETHRRADPLQRCLVIVPSQLLKIHLRRLLAERGCPHLNVQFLTLVDLARALAEQRLGEQQLSPLTAAGRLLLAREVAREASPDSYFGEVRQLTGFALVLAATIRDVRDCLIGAEELAQAASSRKQRDFADLLLAYERRLARAGLVDDSATFRIALESVQDHPLLEGEGPPLVYGFYDFTSAQRRLLEAVIRRVGAVVFAPIGEGPAFDYARKTLVFLEALDFEAATAPSPAPSEKPGEENALRQLQTRLFAPPETGGPLPDDGSVQILICPGEAQEAREVVRSVAQLARELPLFEVGVVLRGTDGVSLLDEALESFCRAAELEPDQRPPVFRQGGRPRLESREARSFLMFLKLIQGGLRRSELFEWLHFSGHERRALSMERLARRAQIVGGHDPELWLAPLKRLSCEPEARRAFEQLILHLCGLAQEFQEAGSHGELTRLAIDSYRRLRSAPDEWLSVLEPLSSLDRLELTVDLSTFIDAVEATLSEESESLGAFQQGLLLGSLLPVRGLPFGVLILPGLREGVFPRKPSPDPILLDPERAELSRRLLPPNDVGLPLTRRARDEERMLFRLALSAARQKLILTYAGVDAVTGSERVPSSLLHSAAESLAGRRLTMAEVTQIDVARRVPIDGAVLEAGQPPLDLAEFDRIRLSRDLATGSSAAVHCLMRLQPTTRAALISERARWQQEEFTAWDGVLSNRIAEQAWRFAVRGPISVSRLEEYAGCPFRFFSRRVLGLHEPEEPDGPDELAPVDPGRRGSLMHSILEQFFRELIDAEEPFPLRESRSGPLGGRLDVVARAQFELFEQQPATVHPFLWESEKQSILDDLRFALEREIASGSDRSPALLEVLFGQGEGHPALKLQIGDRRLELSGTIDRVDLSPDGRLATVIDYKTGEAFTWDGDLQGGCRIQLPVYALALERVIAGQGETTADLTEYFFVTRKGRGAKKCAPSSAWQGQEESDLLPVLGRIVDGIEAGLFFADPGNKKLCLYCDFKLACGLGAGLEERFERKSKNSGAQV